MSDDRSSAYWEGGKLVLRASAFGGCIGALIRTAQGQTPAPYPAKMLKRFAEGNTAEPLIVRELIRRGYMVRNTHGDDGGQLELELEVAGKVVIRCHPDGVVVGDGLEVPHVLEIKALRPSFSRNFRPYEWQNSIEVAASGLPLLKVYGEKGADGELVGDGGGLKLDIVEQGPAAFSLLDIKKRALEIYKAVADGAEAACDFKAYPCGFYREEGTACHWDPEVKAKEKGVIEELPVPEATIQKFLVAKDVAKAAAADLKELDGTLRGMVKDRTGDKYVAGSLTFSRVVGRKTLDRKAMEEDYGPIDWAKYEVAGKSSWRITASE